MSHVYNQNHIKLQLKAQMCANKNTNCF